MNCAYLSTYLSPSCAPQSLPLYNYWCSSLFLTFCLQLIPHQSDLCLITLLTVLRYWLPLCYLWVDSNFFVVASAGREIEDAAHLTEVTRNVLCDVSCHSLLPPHSNASKWVSESTPLHEHLVYLSWSQECPLCSWNFLVSGSNFLSNSDPRTSDCSMLKFHSIPLSF